MASLAGKVLVVEDDRAFATVVEEALKTLGVEAVVARTGDEALKLVADGPAPLAAVLDGLLPGMRGDELALRLRRLFSRDELPIVFISAFFRDMKSRQYLTRECKVDVLAHKPLTRAELLSALRRVPALANATPAPRPAATDDEDGGITIDVAFTEVEASAFAEFVALGAERVTRMRAALAAISADGQWNAQKILRDEAHKFLGTGSTFGVPELSRLGGRMEELLKTQPDIERDPALRARLTGLVDAIAARVTRIGAQAPILTSEASARRVSVLLIDGAGELAASCREAEAQGLPVRVQADVSGGMTAASQERPDVVVVAGDRSGFDTPRAIERFFKAGLEPVVLMNREGSLQRRLDALRRGAAGVVHRVPDAESLHRIASVYARPRVGARVLVVERDHATLELIARAFGPRSLTVEPCPEPERLFEGLDRADPALVVVSLDQGAVGGAELLRVIRGDARARLLPLVALGTGRNEELERLQALEAGADDYLAAPLQINDLTARVLARLGLRARQEGLEALLDPVSGTFHRSYLLDVADRALQLARRGRTLAILVFDADLPGRSEQRLLADEVVGVLGARLRRIFRTSDVVARIDRGRFAVLLHDVAPDDAVRLLEAHLSSFSDVAFGPGGAPVPVAGGIAVFPDVTGSAQELLAAAEKNLARRNS